MICTHDSFEQNYSLIIIGFGMATHRLLQEIAARSSVDVKNILVIGEENCAAYNRVLLPQLLEDGNTDLRLEANWQSISAILSFITGDAVEAIERKSKTVRTQSGKSYNYHQLVIATGSIAVYPDFLETSSEPKLLSRLQNLRNLADAEKISNLPRGSHIMIQGGGFIALETAAALSRHHKVSICHRGVYLMNRQLDPAAGALLANALESKGIQLILNTTINGVKSTTDKLLVAITGPDGLKTVATDLLITALGIKPRIELARAAGITVNKGMVVNSHLQSSDESIFAIGECCEINGETFGLISPIYEQARVLAQQLGSNSANKITAGFEPKNFITSLKISGLAMSSLGDIPMLLSTHDVTVESYIYRDFAQGDYRRVWYRQGQLLGAVLCGDTSLSSFYQQLLIKGSLKQPTHSDGDLLNELLFHAA
jgi:nitrite reductase (NADH) large subunit